VAGVWKRRFNLKDFGVKGKRECGGYLSIALGRSRIISGRLRNRVMWGCGDSLGPMTDQGS